MFIIQEDERLNRRRFSIQSYFDPMTFIDPPPLLWRHVASTFVFSLTGPQEATAISRQSAAFCNIHLALPWFTFWRCIADRILLVFSHVKSFFFFYFPSFSAHSHSLPLHPFTPSLSPLWQIESCRM